MRGYFGIGIWNPKHQCNIGTLFRSALSLGASFVFTVGRQYRIQASDTPKTIRHIPYFKYLNGDELRRGLPHGCQPVCVELTEHAYALPTFAHPLRAAYILGNEVDGIPPEFMKDQLVVKITSPNPNAMCLNVAAAGSIVMYARYADQLASKEYRHGRQQGSTNDASVPVCANDGSLG